MKKLFTILLATAALTFPKQSNSQITGKCPVYQFSYTKMLPATPVKDQAVTGTCWSFATTSFFESELIRMGKGEFDLSEMHTVRYNYINRVKDNYLKRYDWSGIVTLQQSCDMNNPIQTQNYP